MSILLILSYALLVYCVIGVLTGLALTIQRRGTRYLPAGVLLATALVWPVLWLAFVMAYLRRFLGKGL